MTVATCGESDNVATLFKLHGEVCGRGAGRGAATPLRCLRCEEGWVRSSLSRSSASHYASKPSPLCCKGLGLPLRAVKRLRRCIPHPIFTSGAPLDRTPSSRGPCTSGSRTLRPPDPRGGRCCASGQTAAAGKRPEPYTSNDFGPGSDFALMLL